MAPVGLNSVPPTNTRNTSQPPEHDVVNATSTAPTDRASLVMGPPPMPANASLNTAHDPPVPGPGPGPLRHPRPMTAADLHLVLEKEQEAVVNRLTRELTLLRQQTVSVASTVSSTSTGLTDPMESPLYPTISRQHRSSSSLSSHVPPGPAGLTASVSSIAPSRDTALPPSRPSGELSRTVSSREPSVTSPRQPLSPFGDNGLSSLQHPGQQSHRGTASQPAGAVNAPEGRRSASISSTVSTRFEEAAQYRTELEAVKRENEMLRRRVRELEQNLKVIRDPPSLSLDDPSSTHGLVAEMQEATLKEPA